MKVRVHPRVSAKRPDITDADVEAVFERTLRKVPRIDVDPVQWVGVGLDGRGRMLEYIAVETGPDEWLVFHAMSATSKALIEVGLRRR